VARQFANPLLGFVLEDQDFLVFSLAHHPTVDARAADRWGTNGNATFLAASRHDDGIKGNLRSHLALQGVAPNDVALGDFKLLAARLDDRVHNLGTIPGAQSTVNELMHCYAGTARGYRRRMDEDIERPFQSPSESMMSDLLHSGRREDDGQERHQNVLSEQTVYGDTDMNPQADDQKDAHHAEADEHL